MNIYINTNKKKYSIFIFIFLSLLFSSWLEASEEPLRLGIFPRRNAQTTIEMFTPLVRHLSNQLKRDVKLEVSKDYEAFWEAVSANQYDIVHYNQYHYIRSVKEYGYQVILKNEEFSTDQLASALIVRKDSTVTELQDLKGKKLVFGGGPSAMVSYIMNRYLLQEAGLAKEDYTAEFSISPANAVYATYFSHAAAAGAGGRVLSLPSIKKRINPNELKYLATSKAMPHIPWAVKGKMSKELRNKIQNILSNLKNNKPGQSILKKAALTGLNVTHDSEYDEHRRIVKQVLGEDYCVRGCLKTNKQPKTNSFKPSFKISIFPRREKRKTAQMFQPLANYLEKKLNRKVELETHKTFKEFWRGVKEKRYDLIHANQFQYVRSHKLHGYDVILKNEEFGLQTITPAIYVRKDSGINKLTDLKGKNIIFGGGKLAMVSYVGNLQLLQHAGLKNTDYNWKFAVTPPNGCYAMFLGQVDACGAAKVLLRLNSFTKKVDVSKMKMLAANIPLTHVNWAVRQNTDTTLRKKIQDILSELHATEDGESILKKAGLTNLHKSTDSEYDTHRQIIFDVLGEKY